MLFLASLLLIVGIGWLLHRFGKASPLGNVSWMFAAAMISAGWWLPTLFGDSLMPLVYILLAIGVVLYTVACISFLVASFRDMPRCAGNCAGFMIVFFSVLIPVDTAFTMRSHRDGPEAVQETRQLILTLHRLAADIEAIRDRRGRLPRDEAELIGLRGKPTPAYYRDYGVTYKRIERKDAPGEEDYALGCCVADFWGENWDIFGWMVSFHGSRSVRRLDVVLF